LERKVEGKVTPQVLQTILLDEIAGRLAEIYESMQEERAEGVVEPIEPVVITEEGRHLRPPVGKPWMSMDLINDGPNSCWALVNTSRSVDAHEIKKGETYTIDMKRPIIEDVYLWCKPREEASLRIVGVR
jgi:hypothetical protein